MDDIEEALREQREKDNRYGRIGLYVLGAVLTLWGASRVAAGFPVGFVWALVGVAVVVITAIRAPRG